MRKLDDYFKKNRPDMNSAVYRGRKAINDPNQTKTLTHISLASFLWDIGKQNSLRCDAAKRGVPSGAILFAILIFIEK